MTTSTPGELTWEDLDRQLEQEEAEHEGALARLKESANVSNYRPVQVPGAVYERLESHAEGTYYMLNNPALGAYLKLEEKDFFVWSLMDGTRTVKDLVVAYFSEYGSIAFGRVSDLVTQLRAGGLLSDPPINVYREVAVQYHKRTMAYRGELLMKSFLQKDLSITGLDGILSTMYRRGFWVLFSKPLLTLYPVLIVAGIALFVYIVQRGTFSLVETGGKWYFGLLIYAAANMIVVGIHETAHALATKHYGRRVHRGGVMMYFGSPALFVDTMDIWMSPKGARMAVSWAGPYSGLILGSLCAVIIAATGFDDTFVNGILFKMAIAALVFSALLNLNPLLEWDGYFVLMDWLEIPMLRKRSMDFVKRKFLNKIISRESFSREERIFAVFGTMAMLYSVFIVSVLLFFWQSRVTDALGQLGNMSGWVPPLIMALLAVAIGIPVGMALVNIGRRIGRRISNWVYKKFLEGRPANQVAALLVTSLPAAIPSLLVDGTPGNVYTAAAGGGLLAIGIWSSGAAATWYMGSRLQWFFLALPWGLAVLIVALALGAVDNSIGTTADVVAIYGVPLALLALIIVVSPTILSFNGTMLQGAWFLVAAGVALLIAAALVELGDGSEVYVHALALVGIGSVAAGVARIHHKLRTFRPQPPEEVAVQAISDVERLSSAARFIAQGALRQFVQVYGHRALRRLEDQFNEGVGGAAGLGITITNGQVNETGNGSMLERSQRYAAALSHLFSVNSDLSGRRFVERQVQGLYRLMPWEQREIGDEHLFTRLDWMSGVRREYNTTQSSHVNLLRYAPLFAGLSDDDLKAVSDRLRPENHPKNKDIIVQGEPGLKFYLIDAGTVDVWSRGDDGAETLVVELGRGDYFGERALLNDAPRAATCRARTRVQLLSLEKEDFDTLVATRFQVAAEVDEAMERADLLGSMPLFSDVGASQIKLVAAKLVVESYPPGTQIIQQGDIGDKFYVLKSGTAEVRRRAEDSDEETTLGQLGAGEYFGEIALLMHVPRTASVYASGDVELLSLDNASFEELVRDHLQTGRGLEMVSSRRMTQQRRAESLGYRKSP